MSEPFLGQIMSAAFVFAPRGFAQCNGQLLPVQQNAALFALLGTVYGGTGQTTFGLPDLRGRTPFGAGVSVAPNWTPQPVVLGRVTGGETVTLTAMQIPPHNHDMFASSLDSVNSSPSGGDAIGKASDPAFNAPSTSMVPLNGGPLSATGALPHENMQPFQTINMCIALSGLYPTRG